MVQPSKKSPARAIKSNRNHTTSPGLRLAFLITFFEVCGEGDVQLLWQGWANIQSLNKNNYILGAVFPVSSFVPCSDPMF